METRVGTSLFWRDTEPYNPHSRDADRDGLLLAGGALEEGGDGLLLQVGGELAGHPEAPAQQEGVDQAVEILEDHVGHEAADVELHVAGLDLGLDDLLGGAEGEHGRLVQLPPLLAPSLPDCLGVIDVSGDGLGQVGATLQLKLLTQRQLKVLGKNQNVCRGRWNNWNIMVY